MKGRSCLADANVVQTPWYVLLACSHSLRTSSQIPWLWTTTFLLAMAAPSTDTMSGCEEYGGYNIDLSYSTMQRLCVKHSWRRIEAQAYHLVELRVSDMAGHLLKPLVKQRVHSGFELFLTEFCFCRRLEAGGANIWSSQESAGREHCSPG